MKNRLRAALFALRGRPVIFGARLAPGDGVGIRVGSTGCFIANNTILRDDTGHGHRVTG